MVTRNDVCAALRQLGVAEGDLLLIHSSFKSLGPVDGGAETVISGALDALGESGTLVLPTFAQKDFAHAYETWHLDKPSDTGWLTEYFRTRPGSVRSDQATHSVAACGAKAQWLTQTHGHTHKRFGSMGDTPFSADSPWEKMYQENAKILLLGIEAPYITFRHYAEYVYMERVLKKLEPHPEYDSMKDQLRQMGKSGVWPHVNNEWVAAQLAQTGQVFTAQCGNAKLTMVHARPFVDFVLEQLEKNENQILWRIDEVWDTDAWIAWRDRWAQLTE